ncbi:DUF6233 domain-containing protein [Streptomyces humi]|uniref:DUF6233 domain-containing protein n=1 Tax=Streptomyces humi TaxID=1428620 RepID=UPI00062879B8|nr:DUF6233 domain-containing protein [Streptomyces humi]
MCENGPSPLDLLYFARRVVQQQAERSLAEIDRWIAAEERKAAALRHAAERDRWRPDWLVQYGLNRRDIGWLHRGDCWAAAKSGRCRPVTREQALDALRHDVPACAHCQPAAELGFLD